MTWRRRMLLGWFRVLGWWWWRRAEEGVGPDGGWRAHLLHAIDLVGGLLSVEDVGLFLASLESVGDDIFLLADVHLKRCRDCDVHTLKYANHDMFGQSRLNGSTHLYASPSGRSRAAVPVRGSFLSPELWRAVLQLRSSAARPSAGLPMETCRRRQRHLQARSRGQF